MPWWRDRRRCDYPLTMVAHQSSAGSQSPHALPRNLGVFMQAAVGGRRGSGFERRTPYEKYRLERHPPSPCTPSPAFTGYEQDEALSGSRQLDARQRDEGGGRRQRPIARGDAPPSLGPAPRPHSGAGLPSAAGAAGAPLLLKTGEWKPS